MSCLCAQKTFSHKMHSRTGVYTHKFTHTCIDNTQHAHRLIQMLINPNYSK